MREMNPTINFNMIRVHNGSQASGFEELICQLARRQKHSNARLVRVGTPDGGVEAYWIFADGIEYGWQAKYFMAFGNSQWAQIKKSYKTAIKTHPNLKKYYICVPLNRADGRTHGKRTAMQQWDELAKTALEEDGVELIYWGNSELVDLLTKQENCGLRYYWFNSQVFDGDWCSRHVTTAIKDIGPRYFPECNVSLKIMEKFTTLRKNQKVLQNNKNVYDTFIKEVNEIVNEAIRLGVDDVLEVKKACEEIRNIFCVADDCLIDESALRSGCHKIKEWLNARYCQIDGEIRNADGEKAKLWERRQILVRLEMCLSAFQDSANSEYVSLFNNKGVVLCGGAGCGKSHLLAHIADLCMQEKKPCFFLLGQRFINNHPLWQQISEQLGVTCEEETFFQALNVLGELNGERILFMIDALNEGSGIKFWANYLAGFINKIKQYPHISLVISIRSTYWESFKNIINGELCVVKHQGFSNGELSLALKTYFNYFELPEINVPLLNPEFNNPLFLKLFCVGIRNNVRRRIPKGVNGLSRIFNWVLEDADRKIGCRHSQDFKSLHLTNELVITITKKMVEQKIPHVIYNDAIRLIGSVTNGYALPLMNNLLEDLIQEGIFTKDMVYTSESNQQEVVRFTYERMEHFFKAQVLLDSISKDDLLKEFQKGGDLIESIQDEGIAEMLSIIIPEKFNYELHTLLTEECITWGIRQAYLQSLLWRDGNNIDIDALDQFISKYVLDDDDLRGIFIDILFVLVTIEDFPLNANWLHSWLAQYSMAIRDAIWTTMISRDQYENYDSMFGLIDWCSENAHMEWTCEFRLLVAISLSWLFTSTNNFLRNHATVALVRVLKNHLKIAQQLLQQFAQVDDPYVHERLWAAVYGAILNSEINSATTDIAQWTVDNVFKQDEVVPNIFVRDYARNIIEYALSKKVFTLQNIKLIKPPYKSSFPDTLPSNDEIEQLALREVSDGVWNGEKEIITSMATEYGRGVGCYGDFGRYIFQAKLGRWKEFDVQALSNYATLLIFNKYDYSSKCHGRFDKLHRSIGRDTKNIERIGKKYQWISMREVIARVADKYKITLERNYSENTRRRYCPGPWELSCRDVDSTYLWMDTPIEIIRTPDLVYSEWTSESNKWIKTFDDKPEFLHCIEYEDAEKNIWVVLKGNLKWEKPFSNVKDDKGRLTIDILAGFLTAGDVKCLASKMNSNAENIHFKTSHFQTQICLHEYFWSPAYKSLCDSSFNHNPLWDNIDMGGVIAKSNIATSQYFWEGEIGESVSHTIPSKDLATFFHLSPGYHIGEWVSDTKDVVCKEVFINDTNSKVFLIKKDKLLAFLENKECMIAWNTCTEKFVETSGIPRLSGCLEGYVLNNDKLYKLYEKKEC